MTAIHRDFYAKLEQRLGKLRRGKLAPLVGVEDLWFLNSNPDPTPLEKQVI